MNQTEKLFLVSAAREARENAYSPYSGYSVGAALYVEVDEGTWEVRTGCNIENCNFTNTNHAEQVAVANALADGLSPDSFVAIAISTDAQDGGAPCGLCQQTLAEFVSDDFPIFIDCGEQDFREVTLDDAELFRADI